MTITTEQLPTPEENNKDEFFEFAATLPEDAGGFLDGSASPVGDLPVQSGTEGGSGSMAGASAPVPERKVVNVSKKVRRAMNKFKTKAADLPIMWFHQQAKDRPEWELDKDEEDMLKDSIDTVFDVLDVDVQIEPLSWTLTSIWWVLSYPVLAFAFLFLTKKSKSIEKDKEAQRAQQ